MFVVQKYFFLNLDFEDYKILNTCKKSNLNISQSINTGIVFKILNAKYIYSILSSNLNTRILNTDQHSLCIVYNIWLFNSIALVYSLT